MRNRLMASAAGLSSLTRPTVKKKPAAEELKEDPKAAGPVKAVEDDDEEDDDDEKSKKSKKSKAKKAAEDDDEEDDDDEKSKSSSSTLEHTASASEQFLAGAASEREKFKAVLASEAGKAAFKANPDRVVRFLSSYAGSKEDAIATLELFGGSEPAPASRSEPLRERMAKSDVPVAGPDASSSASESGQPDAVSMILAADKFRRGEK